MSAALALAESVGVRFCSGEGGHIRLEAAAPPPKHILDELRRHREAVATLVAERAAREAFYGRRPHPDG